MDAATTPPTDPHASARALAQLDLAAHLADPARKQAFVTPMFDVIAPRYDDFTRIFSFGMDRRWKAALVRDALAALPPGATTALDLACGTGDLAAAVHAARPPMTVTGLDASPRMIDAARQRHGTAASHPGALRFAVGDAMRLELPDASVDLVTAGYCYRNVPDWRAAVHEAARVLRPGGIFADLDFFRPANAAWRALFLWYLRRAGDLVGWAWHRAPVVYGYIAPSIDGFCTRDEFSSALLAAGFAPLATHSRLGGGVAMHIARRR
ncbi:MAG: ubiquinone/menaquinone biosynthesis methyltransferase [Gemmatimonadaceae bacterium]|nr:ubiquinone/menaquinone biosynthesis methyltransferase [Gemmatimonadaceae bacterium]